MKTIGKAIGVAALLLTAGCEVNVDNNLEAALDNQADALGQDIENVADGAGNAIDAAGDAIDNQIDKIDNGIDIKVDLDGKNDAAAANTNAH